MSIQKTFKIEDEKKDEEPTKKDRKQYMKEYLEKNRDRIKEQRRVSYEKHKDTAKEYYKKNQEEINAYNKAYNKTERGLKMNTIAYWKRRGIVHPNFEELYEYYINTKRCEICFCELTKDRYSTKTTKCLKHDKETGLFRNVICHSCSSTIK